MPEKSEMFIFSGLALSRLSNNSEKLTRFKIATDTLMTFAGEFFFLRNRKSQSRYNVVEIEVNFVSTGRDSDKYWSRSFLAVACEYIFLQLYSKGSGFSGASRDQSEPVI